jgi:hypothetical protein
MIDHHQHFGQNLQMERRGRWFGGLLW